jgi:7,8-dihydropterin-6-yl-methyl-4-(beta-D-ribofuranosyl)aminobenzene 5'-phosphate synthase
MRQISLFFALFCINLNASYEVTVLATNISNYGGFGEWSFSALYESDRESVLFDTGFHEDTVLHNAKILGKDLSKVEKVILSHFHSDHTGGLLKLRKTYKELNNKAFTKVYVARGFFNQRFAPDGSKVGPGNYADSGKWKKDAEDLGINFIMLDSHYEVSKNIFATGTVERTVEKYNGPEGLVVKDIKSNKFVPDIILDDQSAGMLTENGWVMMSGCGHSGIINTAKKLQSINNIPVYGAIGGFHLFKASDQLIDKTANWLKNQGMTKFMGGHCTGIYAAERVADIIGISRENLSHTAIGSVLTKDLMIQRSSVE